VNARREPFFNLPPVVTAIIAALVSVYVAGQLLPEEPATLLYGALAFIPARLGLVIAPQATLRHIAELSAPDADLGALAAYLNEASSAWWTLLTYALLHAGATHLGVNSLSLAAFGAPLARRFGAARFLGFFCVAAIAGALTFFILHPFELSPVVGASGAISGVMAGVARFAFAPGGALAEDRRRTRSEETPAQSLVEMTRSRRAATFLLVWFGLNFLFGALPEAAGAGVDSIAWEAHLGGFLAGLLLFGLFDPPHLRIGPDPEKEEA
jgi:membrane associated rhomboid family serine protease